MTERINEVVLRPWCHLLGCFASVANPTPLTLASARTHFITFSPNVSLSHSPANDTKATASFGCYSRSVAEVSTQGLSEPHGAVWTSTAGSGWEIASHENVMSISYMSRHHALQIYEAVKEKKKTNVSKVGEKCSEKS